MPVVAVPWKVFVADPVRVRYRLTISTPAGLSRTMTMKIDVSKLIGSDSGQHPTLEAGGRITIRADLELSIDPKLTVLGERVEVGFLQTLTRNISVAEYRAIGRTPTMRFQCVHDTYPVKDGEGDPWYKNPVVATLNSSPVPVQRSVEIYDAPKFTYPAQIPTRQRGVALQVGRLICKRDFLTCLALRHRGQLRAIHSIAWRFAATGNAQLPPAGGLALVSEEGPLLQFQTEPGVPADIRTTGPSANLSEKIQLHTM